MTAPPSGHTPTLDESDYGFRCWVWCECGWRSQSYPTSAAAAKAWAVHVDSVATVGGEQ